MKLILLIIVGFHCDQLDTKYYPISLSQGWIHYIIGDLQCVFQRNRSSTDGIFCVCQIRERKNGSTTKQCRQVSIGKPIIWWGGKCVQWSRKVWGTHETGLIEMISVFCARCQFLVERYHRFAVCASFLFGGMSCSRGAKQDFEMELKWIWGPEIIVDLLWTNI